jgi:hypothetical protein
MAIDGARDAGLAEFGQLFRRGAHLVVVAAILPAIKELLRV